MYTHRDIRDKTYNNANGLSNSGTLPNSPALSTSSLIRNIRKAKAADQKTNNNTNNNNSTNKHTHHTHHTHITKHKTKHTHAHNKHKKKVIDLQADLQRASAALLDFIDSSTSLTKKRKIKGIQMLIRPSSNPKVHSVMGQTYVHTYIHTYIHTCAHSCLFFLCYVCVCVCVCVCM